MKKVLSLLLALTCAIAVLAIPAFADEYPEGITSAVIMKPDGSHKMLDGTELSALRFVFGEEVFITGYNCKWQICLIDPENDNEILAHWNCDNDENMLVDDEETNTQWGLFTWGMDTKGYATFTVWFSIPSEGSAEREVWDENVEAGTTLWELAEAGRLGAYFGDYNPVEHEQNGVIDCDPGNDPLKANCVIDDLDACFAAAKTETGFYGELGDVEDPNAPAKTEAKDTEYVPATKAPETTSAPAEETSAPTADTAAPETKAPEAKKGCKSMVGLSALALVVLAAPAVLAKKH